METDSDGIVQNFYEKVEYPPGNQANGAIYVFDQKLLKLLRAANKPLVDFSTDVLPWLIGRIYTFHTNNPFIDIGTPENLKKARQIWSTSETAAL